MPRVSCPRCHLTFASEEHPEVLDICPSCSRQFRNEIPDIDARCPKCIENWNEYLAHGGVDTRKEMEVNSDPAREGDGGTEDPQTGQPDAGGTPGVQPPVEGELPADASDQHPGSEVLRDGEG